MRQRTRASPTLAAAGRLPFRRGAPGGSDYPGTCSDVGHFQGLAPREVVRSYGSGSFPLFSFAGHGLEGLRGRALQDRYRQLFAHAQRLLPMLRPHLRPAWDMVSRWEELQPVAPAPEVVLKAMVAVALAFGWRRWAAVTAAKAQACSHARGPPG